MVRIIVLLMLLAEPILIGGCSPKSTVEQLPLGKYYIDFTDVARQWDGPFDKQGIPLRDYGSTFGIQYPSLQAPPHVLNGFIFALFGLYDFYKLTHSEVALDLFNEGIETLKANLKRYDLGYWSRYDLTELFKEYVYLFRFVTEERHPRHPHPIDRIVLYVTTNTGEQFEIALDVGADGDADDIHANKARLYYSPTYQDWGDSYVLDGRAVRNYENLGGRYAHAPFEFMVELREGNSYRLEVVYKDTYAEPIYVEMYADGVKYIRMGQLQAVGDGKWKAYSVELPLDLLMFKTGASLRYHEWHIQQLGVLGKITEEPIFLVYAEIWEAYRQAVVANSWWHDIRNSVNRRLRHDG